MASMGVGLRVTSPAVVEGSVKINGSSRLNVTGRVTVPQRSGLVVRAQQSEAAPETTRRSVIGLVAAGLAGGSFVQAVLADAVPIKIGPPPPPSGGLRQITQTKRAVARAKESAKEIVNVKSLIDEKAWPIRIASLSSFFQVYPNKGFVPSLDRCLTKFQPWFVFLFSQGHGKGECLHACSFLLKLPLLVDLPHTRISLRLNLLLFFSKLNGDDELIVSIRRSSLRAIIENRVMCQCYQVDTQE